MKSREEQIHAWAVAIIGACRRSQSAPNVFESIDDWANEIRKAVDRPERLSTPVLDALRQCEAYMDDRADADLPHGALGPQPNEEMRLLPVIRTALSTEPQS